MVKRAEGTKGWLLVLRIDNGGEAREEEGRKENEDTKKREAMFISCDICEERG